ncbi:fasciclin domain-containing protein [Lyngbya confervoides]|uniref:fasciclin domain-containing protein n=1 Tax=Lyngbya confervoides TaxID=207921 RepID=UPI0035C8D58D
MKVSDASAAQSAQTIVDIASSSDVFETLVAAVKAADLVETLSGEGPFTVFAPTDEAFAALPEGTVETLLKPENKDVLTKILTYHVIPGSVTSDQVTSGSVPTVEGQSVEIDVDASSGSVKVNGANVVKTDIAATNGVIHVIDAVILPPEM